MRSGNGGMGEDEEGGRRGRREGRERDLSEMIVLGIVGFMMVPFPRFLDLSKLPLFAALFDANTRVTLMVRFAE